MRKTRNSGPAREPLRFKASAGGILLFALLYFFDETGLTAALLPAVLAHELGHVAALRRCGCRVLELSLGVFGLRLDYAGVLTRRETVFCALLGPLAGLVWAWAACIGAAAGGAGGALLRFSGTVSFRLSVFNLLPCLPLDGGRVLAALTGERAALRFSAALSLALAAAGAALLLQKGTPALLAAGLWLFLRSLKGFRGELSQALFLLC